MSATSPTIPDTVGTLWTPERGWCVVRNRQTVEQLAQRLADGEWLQLMEVSRLVGRSRAAVARWITIGKTPTGLELRHRADPINGYRVCNPVDVRKILAAIQQEAHDRSEEDQGGTEPNQE